MKRFILAAMRTQPGAPECKPLFSACRLLI